MPEKVKGADAEFVIAHVYSLVITVFETECDDLCVNVLRDLVRIFDSGVQDQRPALPDVPGEAS